MNSGRSPAAMPVARAMPHSTSALTSSRPTTIAATSSGCAAITAKSMVTAHGDEEQPEQQALEGLDIGLQLAPVFALGQQHAPAGKAPSAIDSPTECISAAVAHHQQQRRRGEDLRRIAARDPAQRRTQQQPPAEDDVRPRPAPWPR